MARRSRSRKKTKSNPRPMLAGIASVAVAVGLGYYFINQKDKSDAKDFPLQSYVNDGNSLRGNTYQVSGEVFSKPFHDPVRGQKVYVRVDEVEANYPAGLPRDIGITIPASVDGPNLETKQSYAFIVNVTKGGNLEATKYTSQ